MFAIIFDEITDMSQVELILSIRYIYIYIYIYDGKNYEWFIKFVDGYKLINTVA
jgi:hypothetical protein